LFAGLVYMCPSVIAVLRMRENTLRVFLINAFFGWTGVGWFWAMYLAFVPNTREGSNAVTDHTSNNDVRSYTSWLLRCLASPPSKRDEWKR
jgi:hypothetical protein